MGTRFSKPLFFVLILNCCLACSGDRRDDRSLPVHTYSKWGMPDPSSQWDMEDYTQAHNVLARIKWDQPLSLPIKQSEKSGALFDRMVSLELLSFLDDSTMSLNEKAERISMFTKIYDYWMDVYTNPTLKGNYYHREIIDVQIFNLKVTEAMLDLAHQINRSDDPADVALRYGYESIKGNYLACLSNDLRVQSHTSKFSRPDLERLADSIFSSVVRNSVWMDSAVVTELKQSLRTVMDSTSSEHIRNKYQQLENILAQGDRTELKSQYSTK